MNTVIIYDQVFEQPISFYVVEGNYKHLDGVYGNSTKDQHLQDELFKLVFNDDWTNKPALDSFPVGAVKPDTVVIVCGFIP